LVHQIIKLTNLLSMISCSDTFHSYTADTVVSVSLKDKDNSNFQKEVNYSVFIF